MENADKFNLVLNIYHGDNDFFLRNSFFHPIVAIEIVQEGQS